MKGYDNYKDSCINFIGKIPLSWKPTKLKYYVNVVTGNTPSTIVDDFFSDEKGIPWVKPSDLNGFNKITTSKQYLTEKGLSQSRLVRKGSVLIGGIGDIGKLGVAGCDITTNQQIHSVEGDVKKVDDEFLKYLLYFSIEELQKNSSSVVLSILTKTKLLDLDIVLPSSVEQTAIASFLDYKTNLIDTTIEKKKRLIELLKEKRQAVINEAVTKGLNPNALMKDGGVEWLGEIPVHWVYSKLKWISNIYAGGTPSTNVDRYWENGDVPWLNSGTVNQKRIKSPSNYITQEALLNSSTKWVPKNSILMALAGQGKTKGTVGILEIEATCNQSMAAIVPDKNEIDYEFLYYWLHSNYQRIRGLASSDQRDGLNLVIVGDIFCPLPAIEEQQLISIYLNNFEIKNDYLIEKLEIVIEKLQSYRQSLISEAVTGKIDVREWQSKK